jgi:hypothetical protein
LLGGKPRTSAQQARRGLPGYLPGGQLGDDLRRSEGAARHVAYQQPVARFGGARWLRHRNYSPLAFAGPIDQQCINFSRQSGQPPAGPDLPISELPPDHPLAPGGPLDPSRPGGPFDKSPVPREPPPIAEGLDPLPAQSIEDGGGYIRTGPAATPPPGQQPAPQPGPPPTQDQLRSCYEGWLGAANAGLVTDEKLGSIRQQIASGSCPAEQPPTAPLRGDRHDRAVPRLPRGRIGKS